VADERGIKIKVAVRKKIVKMKIKTKESRKETERTLMMSESRIGFVEYVTGGMSECE
jgi:DNA-directed RNA polymerase subunit E'/Rpb7